MRYPSSVVGLENSGSRRGNTEPSGNGIGECFTSGTHRDGNGKLFQRGTHRRDVGKQPSGNRFREREDGEKMENGYRGSTTRTRGRRARTCPPGGNGHSTGRAQGAGSRGRREEEQIAAAALRGRQEDASRSRPGRSWGRQGARGVARAEEAGQSSGTVEQAQEEQGGGRGCRRSGGRGSWRWGEEGAVAGWPELGLRGHGAGGRATAAGEEGDACEGSRARARGGRRLR